MLFKHFGPGVTWRVWATFFKDTLNPWRDLGWPQSLRSMHLVEPSRDVGKLRLVPQGFWRRIWDKLKESLSSSCYVPTSPNPWTAIGSILVSLPEKQWEPKGHVSHVACPIAHHRQLRSISACTPCVVVVKYIVWNVEGYSKSALPKPTNLSRFEMAGGKWNSPWYSFKTPYNSPPEKKQREEYSRYLKVKGQTIYVCSRRCWFAHVCTNILTQKRSWKPAVCTTEFLTSIQLRWRAHQEHSVKARS
jgi:hypothetical protein